MPQNSNFRLPRGHRFFAKIGSYIYGAKSRSGLPRVHFGANGVPLGPKMGQNGKITMLQKSNFRRPRGHRFFPKNGSYGDGAKSRWGPPRVHLGANGVPLGKKRVKTVKNYHVAKFEFSTTLQSSIFPKKLEVTVMAPNHGGDPLWSILEPMGSHWVQKMGQNRAELPCRKIRILDYPVVIDFSQKMEVTVMAPNHGGDSLGSI